VTDKILDQMKRGVYYPGHHLGRHEELEQLVLQGYLERMDASFICGPDSEAAYCLTEEGCRLKKRRRSAPADGTDRQPH
jgi:hypothetical protein